MRSTLITTLCILTFLWNSIKVYNSFSTYQGADNVVENMSFGMQEMQETMYKDMNEKEQEEATKALDAFMATVTPDKLRMSNIFTIISALLLILGGVWMWDMKKRGFWVYLAGNIIGILTPIIIFGGPVGITFGILVAIVSAIFTALYYSQIKQMV